MTTDTRPRTLGAQTPVAGISDWTPPRWVNATVTAMLHVPGLERLFGRSIALITVTGGCSGKRYTLPVTYDRFDDTVLVLTRPFRTWWRNVIVNPRVELRLAGRTVNGRAAVSIDDPWSLPLLIDFLEHRRRDARAYGITFTPDGRIDEDQARVLLARVVMVRIHLDGATRRYGIAARVGWSDLTRRLDEW